MDNKAYLDEIAVKGKKKFASGPLLTPVMIKIIIVGVAALICMIVVASMLGSKGEDNTSIHQAVYLRVNSLLDSRGPVQQYLKKVKASDVRTYTSSLISSLTTTEAGIKSASGRVGFTPGSAPSEVSTANSAQITTLTTELERAYLRGNLDVTYASNLAYQLTLLISLEKQARTKTNDDAYAKVLDASMRDLEKLEENYRNYADNN